MTYSQTDRENIIKTLNALPYREREIMLSQAGEAVYNSMSEDEQLELKRIARKLLKVKKFGMGCLFELCAVFSLYGCWPEDVKHYGEEALR